MQFLECTKSNSTIMGRYETSIHNSWIFSFPGVSISLLYKNTAVYARLKDYGLNGMNNHFAVFVDGILYPTIKIANQKNDYLVVPFIDNEWHTVQLYKRTESEVGECEFFGFLVDDNAIMQQIAKSNISIEFIGDSITCGYGIEAKLASDIFEDFTENAWLSFASVTARMLDADYSLVSYSGRGVYRNWASEPFSGDNMSDIYSRTLADRQDSVWNFAQCKPTIVVVNLGSNDFSPPQFVDEGLFTKTYSAFIATIRQKYGNECFVFCVTGPVLTKHLHKTQDSIIKSIVDNNKKKGDTRIYFFSMTRQDGKKGFGAQWHPSILQSEYNGIELSEFIGRKLKIEN